MLNWFLFIKLKCLRYYYPVALVFCLY